MESKNARFLRDGLVATARKLTTEQRLRAFIEHSRMMKTLRELGEKRRADPEAGSRRDG